MTRLSVNINKIATLRNSRGGNKPDVLKAALDCERFGAEGITVHPRPDERHIRYQDARDIKKAIRTEFNIEGNPVDKFNQLIEEVLPDQVTLVPDAIDAITSNAGWDTKKNKKFLEEVVAGFKRLGVRVSIFVDPHIGMVEGAYEVGADRIELYTEPYAAKFPENKAQAVIEYVEAAKRAKELGLGVNAGHDLDLKNLRYLKQNIPWMDEVSIGHALISDAIYMGLENTIQLYLRELEV